YLETGSLEAEGRGKNPRNSRHEQTADDRGGNPATDRRLVHEMESEEHAEEKVQWGQGCVRRGRERKVFGQALTHPPRSRPFGHAEGFFYFGTPIRFIRFF